MKILTEQQLLDFPQKLLCSCTLGMFDGLHRGHLFLLNRLYQKAQSTQTPTLVINFSSHPAEALRGKTKDFLLSTSEERIQRFRQTKLVDYLYQIPSEAKLWSLDEKEFLEQKIYPFFHIKIFLMGHDSRFGKNRKGDIVFLQNEGKEKGFMVEEVNAVHFSDQNEKISSTQIRLALKEHCLDEANNMLGYVYTFSGIVVKGDQRGRTIGFPTANISPLDARKLIPQYGVYAVTLSIQVPKHESKIYQGVMNIGIRPTFDLGEQCIIEVHILDFNDDIYDAIMQIQVHHFLRVEQKFQSVNHLIRQLQEDKRLAKEWFLQNKIF